MKQNSNMIIKVLLVLAIFALCGTAIVIAAAPQDREPADKFDVKYISGQEISMDLTPMLRDKGKYLVITNEEKEIEVSRIPSKDKNVKIKLLKIRCALESNIIVTIYTDKDEPIGEFKGVLRKLS